LVDVGCGNGASAFFLADKFKYVLGIDVWEGHLVPFNAYKQYAVIKNVDFLTLNLETETHDQQYDRLISFEVIEHLSDDKHVSSFYNLVKKGVGTIRRFGKLGDAYIKSINSLTIAQLEDLGEALLDFGDINDLEQWLKSHTES
jgi:2-polyprenyl-3-methyl-5-hydroxy-6-metoxy-1,4-benzoquinol methylase